MRVGGCELVRVGCGVVADTVEEMECAGGGTLWVIPT